MSDFSGAAVESRESNSAAKPVFYHPKTDLSKAGAQKVIPTTPFGLYLHIPFCETKCYFCTFEVVAGRRVNQDLIERYLVALNAEIDFYAEKLSECRAPIDTIQIGGGTPSTLSADQLATLLWKIRSSFDCSHALETMVEGFPTTLTEEKLAVLTGVPNIKLNIGVQTLNSEVLATLGRPHTGPHAITALKNAVGAGLPSVGADLIYGLPGGSVSQVHEDVDTVSDLGVDHVALYPLWVYPKTTLGAMARSGKFTPSTIEEKREQLAVASERLRAHGFKQYTRFHWSRAGTQHLYGVHQFADESWLGLGQGAESYIDGNLYRNEPRIDAYMDRMARAGDATAECKRLSNIEQFGRALAYGLRLHVLDIARLERKFATRLPDSAAAKFDDFEARGLVTRLDGAFQLSDEGVLHLGTMEAELLGG